MGVQKAVPSPFSILDNAAHPHESFREGRELEAHLKSSVRGEVRFDRASRALYATDASNYRQVPIGVVVPRDVADVEATIAACRAVQSCSGRNRDGSRRGK